VAASQVAALTAEVTRMESLLATKAQMMAEVGRCRLTASKLVLNKPMASVLESITPWTAVENPRQSSPSTLTRSLNRVVFGTNLRRYTEALEEMDAERANQYKNAWSPLLDLFGEVGGSGTVAELTARYRDFMAKVADSEKVPGLLAEIAALQGLEVGAVQADSFKSRVASAYGFSA